MSTKQALEGTRQNAFGVDPDTLVIVGLDTDDGPEHPFWDKRAKLPIKEGLVKSMMTIGWFSAILVQKQSDGNVYVMDGRQRVKAAREANKRLKSAGKELILVTCMPRRGGDADIVGVAANELSQHDEPLVKAEKAAAMLNRGRTEEEVCISFDLSVSGLRNLLSLCEAHPSIRKAVEKGEINTTAAYELGRLELGKQEAALKELVASVATKNGTRGIGAAARNVVRGKRAKANGHAEAESFPAPSPATLRAIAHYASEWAIDPTAIQTIKWMLGMGSAAKISGLTAAVRAIEEKREKQKAARDAKKSNGKEKRS